MLSNIFYRKLSQYKNFIFSLQIYLKTLNVKMAAIALKNSLNRIPDFASKYASSMIPFFFVRNESNQSFSHQQNLTLKVNREMTPFLSKLPKNAKLGFWNAQQFDNSSISQQTLQNSIILNPFKTEKLILSALCKGIKKMLVSDIQEVIKIQQFYFKLRRNNLKVDQPSYIWNVEDYTTDLQNVINLQKCDLDINGLYFTKEICFDQVERFLENVTPKNKNFQILRETTLQNLEKQGSRYEQKGIQPMITNFSEINKYKMVCRILGRDKAGKPIFDNATLDFICKADTCSCSAPPLKVENTFQEGGFEWAVIEPARLDKLQPSHILY